MKRSVFLFLMLCSAGFQAGAQGLRVVFQDALFGTTNGVVLSSSVMAFERKVEVDQLRWGVGAGILYGVGTGIYDLTQAGGADEYYVDATFGQAGSTAAVTLMDTGYGAGTGMLLGLSWSLIANKDIVESVLTGYGAGVWGGFIFGLVDGFYLSRSSDMPFSGSDKGFFSALPRKGDLYLAGPAPSVFKKPTENGYEFQPAVRAFSAKLHF